MTSSLHDLVNCLPLKSYLSSTPCYKLPFVCKGRLLNDVKFVDLNKKLERFSRHYMHI